jgi:hypothetical protein
MTSARWLSHGAMSIAAALATTSSAACPGAPPGCGEGPGKPADLATGTWSVLPSGPLRGRDGEATVWTGTQLIVWGGANETSALANGASFQPTTSQWALMPQGPLSARSDAAAVWTGREAVFWGGRTWSGSYAGNGASYDPVARSWQLLPRAPLGALTSAEASWTGSEVVVVGTTGQPPISFNRPSAKGKARLEAAAFNPETSRWTQLPSFPAAAAGQPISSASAWTGSELVVVVFYEDIVPIGCRAPCTSGYTIKSAVVSATWQRGARTWHILPAPPAHSLVSAYSYGASATWTGKWLVLVGGSPCLPGMSCPLFPEGMPLEALDPATGQWRLLSLRSFACPTAWTGKALVLADPSGWPGPQFPGKKGQLLAARGAAASLGPRSLTGRAMPSVPARVLNSGDVGNATMAWTGVQLLLLAENAMTNRPVLLAFTPRA